MLLTAQLVRGSSGEGINAFCNLHGPQTWQGPPPERIPEQDPGRRANEHIEVPVGGNRVRSYLDVVAPDETPTFEVLAAFPTFVAKMREQPLPWVGTVDRCTFRFQVEPALIGKWAELLGDLFEAALCVRVPF